MASSEKTVSGDLPARSRGETLANWEMAVIDYFVRAAALFGMRKSVGLVYGALYCAREPLSVAALQEKLSLSRGAVVEALQGLRRLGAVRLRFKIGERRDFFSAETDLKKFVRGVLREVLVPATEKAEVLLAQAAESAGTADSTDGNGEGDEEAAFARSRVAELAQWKARFSEIFPLLEQFLDASETEEK